MARNNKEVDKEVDSLQDIWKEAIEHAEIWQKDKPTEHYIPTNDYKVTVDGDDENGSIDVMFHIDNSPAIYYDVCGYDDLVYVNMDEIDETDEFYPAKSDKMYSFEMFENRVKDIVDEQLSQIN